MSEHKQLIIVSGLPRSGTSLMMQMLALGGVEALTDELRQADVDNPKGYFEFERVKKIKEDKAWIPAARGKAVKMISQLLYELPETEPCKIIFMRRELDEVIVSQEKMLRRRGVQAPDPASIKVAFTTHLDKLFSWLAMHPNFQVIEVNYNELMREPRAHAERIAQFLGQPLDLDAMARQVDASLYRNRERVEGRH